MNPWRGFAGEGWRQTIDVRDFIQNNYTPYTGDEGFLAPITPKTRAVWEKAEALIREETDRGLIDVETGRFSGTISPRGISTRRTR